MGNRYIPLSVPNLKGNELNYVTHAIQEEWVSTAGPYIISFEENLAKYVGAQGAVACQSGTAGLHLALKVLGINEEDEVIVPTMTFVAAVNPIRYVGAEPIFMDCDCSLTIDSQKLKKFCEEECEYKEGKLINRRTHKHISAIVVVHVFGNLADLEGIMETAKKYGLYVIEDATEALGSYFTAGKYAGKYAGTIGDIGVYSFNGNKIITTGGGGMIVSGDMGLLDRCRSLSTQAKRDTVYFDHEEVGYNYRMTNIQAALGLGQLEQLEKFIQIKKEHFELYQKNGIELLGFNPNTRPNYWFYSYMTPARDEIISYLESKGIQTRPVWKLIHTLDMYKGCQTFGIEKALYYYKNIVNLPCSSNLNSEDVLRVAEEIKAFG